MINLTRHFFLVSLLFVILFTNVNGQNRKRFERISIEQGLSQSTVSCIFQDSRGFLWFGTEDGLNKYDGYKFTVFTLYPDNPNGLSSNSVLSIYEDRDSTLWIGTRAGLNKFSRDTEQFVRYMSDSRNEKSISDDRIWCILEDSRRNLWIGTWTGLNRMEKRMRFLQGITQTTLIQIA